MSTVKISELTALTSADAADELVIVDDSAGVTKKITQGNLNVLIENADDYEEGTWTPALKFGGNDVSLVYNYRDGHYVKIGNLVFFTLVIALTNKGSSSGGATIEDLPFGVADSLSNTVREASAYTGWFANISNLALISVDSSDSLSLRDSSSGALDNTDFANNSSIRISGSYITS